MNEGQKTAIFAGIAVLVGCVWLIARPRQESFVPDQIVGEVLFEDLDDPGDAATLEILRYNEELGDILDFKVAKNGKTGLWSIPSHSGYPADAEERIRDVATSLVGTKVLGVVSTDASEHELLGVVEPSDETELGEKGVGLLISFEDLKGKRLASLIIGKPIKGADGHRFVREPGKDLVYDIEIDPDRFSTNFEDWIKPDLLEINTLDIEKLKIKDYSVLRTLNGFQPQPQFDAICNWNSTDSKWELEEFLTYGKFTGPESLTPIRSELGDGEELDSDRLNELKTALDDLKIVDVRSKPPGLRADLKADTDFLNGENVQSLLDRGFYPLRVGDAEPEILSANGELSVYMKDGYELLLRFGNVAGTQQDSEEAKLNRYLFVTAMVTEGKFPEPELEEVPQKQGPTDVPAAPPADAADDAAADDAAADDAGGDAAADENAADSSDASADEAAAEEKDEDSSDAPAEESELDKEIARIKKENQRKLDEWNDKRDKAVEKVHEINARFADWYYVVSEDVYKKIRLGRNDLFKESENAAEAGFGVDAFRKLQDDGLSQQEETESTDNPQ